jgi:trk system potassium uptake protein
MLHLTALFNIAGRFLMVLAGVMLIPLLISLFAGEDPKPFIYTVAVTGLIALLFQKNAKKSKKDFSQREAILLVVLIWISSSLLGCLPFYFSPWFPGFTDAFFEATSGFTTTGATTLAEVEVLPMGLQFWRCMTHWLGGMGIVLLGIAVLPLVGMGGVPLYRAEFSGAKSEKLKPRIKETALALWKIYFAITVALYLSLRFAGMQPFDALCHTFSTLGTGGFSTRTGSIADFNSVAIETVIVFFMFLAGINFTLHYRLWVERRPGSFFSDIELRFYTLIFLSVTAAIVISLVFQNNYSLTAALRASLFQVCSILTTTGFVTSNFGTWSSFAQLMLLSLMFMGGCTGSTSSGLKPVRILLLLKVVGRDFKRMIEWRGVFPVRLGARAVPEHSLQSLLNLVYLAFFINFISCLLLAATGLDLLTSISAVAASMFNIGPGLGAVGPVDHYGNLPMPAKWVLSMCMLAGRLEFYTVLIIFTPAFWRR